MKKNQENGKLVEILKSPQYELNSEKKQIIFIPPICLKLDVKLFVSKARFTVFSTKKCIIALLKALF